MRPKYGVGKAFDTATTCCFCGTQHDLASAAGEIDTLDRQFSEDDLSFCAECGEWSMFRGGRLTPPTDADYEDIANSDICRAMRYSWEKFQKEKRLKLARAT